MLGRADGGPLTEVYYLPVLLWAVLFEVVRPSITDERDRAIYRRGE